MARKDGWLSMVDGRIGTAWALALLVFGWVSIFPLGSFLIDPFLLVALGGLVVYVSGKLVLKGMVRRLLVIVLCVLTLGIFYVCSVSLYLDSPWIGWMWRLCGAETGRDWMLNSGVLHFDYVNTPVYGHLIGGALFVLYPVWLYGGILLGEHWFDRAER